MPGFLAVVAFFAFFVPAMAANNTDPAVSFVQKMGDKALSSLTAPELPTAERERRVRDLLRSNFDVDMIGRAAMGVHWRTATEKERGEYLRLFESMIVRTYAQRFAEYSGQSFKVGTSSPAGTKDILVSSQIIQKNGPPVSIGWRLRGSAGQMKIIDVLVEGISMMVTQRSDFDAVIQSGGGKVSALLQSMRERQSATKSAKKD